MRESLKYPQHDEELADVLAVWGDYHGVERILADCGRRHWQMLQCDNGYIGRGHFSGYYSLSWNARQATDDLWKREAHADRFAALEEPLKPWRKTGDVILVLAPSKKHARLLGLDLEPWCHQVKRTCEERTNKRIIVQVKTYGQEPTPRQLMQRESVALVIGFNTKSMCEALLEGIPILSLGPCVVNRMGLRDLVQINDPFYPDNRADFFSRLAYHQWRLDEIAAGLPFHNVLCRT